MCNIVIIAKYNKSKANFVAPKLNYMLIEKLITKKELKTQIKSNKSKKSLKRSSRTKKTTQEL